MATGKSSGTIQTVKRIAEILRCFTESDAELGVMRVSRATGLHKSTTSRLLAALSQEGFVEKNPETGKYRLGLGLVNLAGMVLEGQGLRQAAQMYLQELAERTHETINISIRDGQACINVESIRSPKSIRYAGRLGRRTPLHCTSTGKILLAFLAAEERRALLQAPLSEYTPNTITDPNELTTELDEITARGYAISREEFEAGLVAIAAPIYDHTSRVSAALSISGPTYRMEPDQLQAHIPHLLTAARNISRQLGFIGAN